MKVIVTVPYLYRLGGVANFFEVMAGHFGADDTYFEIGSVRAAENLLRRTAHLLGDWAGFTRHLRNRKGEYDIAHINPSFGHAALIRDGGLIGIAKSHGLKTVVFFHGWNDSTFQTVRKYFGYLFYSTFNKADAFVVLAKEFGERLRDCGFTQPIWILSTPVSDELLDGFSIDDHLKRIERDGMTTLLFLSRIELVKGIAETVKAFDLAKKKYPQLRLLIAGSGHYSGKLKEEIERMESRDSIQILGYVSGQEKRRAFEEADAYVFPTYHHEGMPTSVLEAMAFGLPVITRPVGGIRDFFVNEEHGYVTESKNPTVIASLIERMLVDRGLTVRMSRSVHEYAKERFMASVVAGRLTDIYEKTLAGDEAASARQ
ncbi:MAG: glycosyltransferase [Thermodesulfobacteriota bacterium]|nr:glycosyltransferase [Thermodesulfobacteriota bacterium]